MNNIKSRVNDYIAQGIVDKDQLLSDLISRLSEEDLRRALYESDCRETLDLDDLDDNDLDEDSVDFDEWEEDNDTVDDDSEEAVVIDDNDREWWR